MRQYWGRYLDRLEKRGKEWKIIQRTYVAHGVFDVDITNGSMGTIEGLHMRRISTWITHSSNRIDDCRSRTS